MANINKIRLSGQTYDIQDSNATKTVELTQAQYDALTVKDPNTFYVITDAQGADLSNYYTKSETSGATEISTALASKQDTLVSRTNIKTINNESILGEGNIEIQGGGKAVSAGTNISITTGETADTINCTLPITKIQGRKSVIIGDSRNTVDGESNLAVGYQNSINSYNGSYIPDHCLVSGEHNNVYNTNETAFGKYNKSIQNSLVGGESGTTLFSVGNGTSNSARHNAFEIRRNGDIYITKDGADVKLQDQLGGGGSSYTAGDGIDITNDVISVNSGVVTTNKAQDITAKKTIIGEQMLDFKQINDTTKLGFTFRDTGGTEISSFQYRPNTISGRALLALQDYQGTATSTRTHNYIGFRHYDNRNGIKAAYTLSTPLPEDAKAPFSLTTSYQHFFFPMGFKNGSTMITTDNTGVVDFSDVLGGLKLVKLSQSEYDSLATKDNSTLYVIVN